MKKKPTILQNWQIYKLTIGQETSYIDFFFKVLWHIFFFKTFAEGPDILMASFVHYKGSSKSFLKMHFKVQQRNCWKTPTGIQPPEILKFDVVVADLGFLKDT